MIDFAAPTIAMVCGVQNGKMMITNPMDAKLAINKFSDEYPPAIIKLIKDNTISPINRRA